MLLFAAALAEIRKDQPSVGDVHVSTALGNQRTSRRRFKEVLRNRRAVAQTTQDPDWRRQATAKADWSITVPISKLDEDQRLAFGWASVIEEDGKPVVDSQGDMITEADLEKAFYGFAEDYRAGGEMHERSDAGRMVECVVFSKAKQAALGINLNKVGAWVGFRFDAPTFAKVKSGEYPAFSIGGSGRREAVADQAA